MLLKRGDIVRKTGGDYSFQGRIVTVFYKFGGAGTNDLGPERIVVQNDKGLLLIMNPAQVVLMSKSQEAPLVILMRKLREEIEGNYSIGESTNKMLAITGEPYIEIASTFDFDSSCDEEHHRILKNAQMYAHPEEAIAAALKNFKSYERWFVNQSSPRDVPSLYWRMVPEIDTFEGKWKVYMRCLLSAKPPLDPQSLSQLLDQRSSLSRSVSFR